MFKPVDNRPDFPEMERHTLEFWRSTDAFRKLAPALRKLHGVRRVRAAVAAAHEVTPHDVVLLRPGALPRTTSGKVSGRATRDGYLDDSLERFDESPHANVRA